MSYTLVDSDVGPFSSASELRAHIQYLNGLPDDDGVQLAKEQAQAWLKLVEKEQAKNGRS